MQDSISAPKAHFSVTCLDAEGNVKWNEEVDNLVLTAGKTDIVDKYLKGSAYTAAWYLLLKGAGTIAVGDTLASHAGWTELQPYAGTNRPAITWGTTASGSNTSTAVGISINATATVAGAGITPVQTGTSGLLYNAADFSVARSVVYGDTLYVTVTISVSSNHANLNRT
jgi:hypothetical protein